MGLVKIAEGELLVNDIPAHEALADIEVTNRFVKLAESLRKIAPRSDDFLYFTAIMLHGAEAALIDPKTGEPKKDKAGKLITGGFDDKWKWVCSDTNLDPYANQNGDIFPSSELKKAYAKWRGRPLCINHQSADVEGVRGIIIDTHWDDKYKRVVGLCALDKKSYPDLAHKVKSGYANNVSMGTAVGRALCTVCQKIAITEKDYCDCIRLKKGLRINGVKVGEINLDLNPIELSLVVTPADQQAKVLRIIASMNNYVDQRNSLLEDKDRTEEDKIAKLDGSIKNVEAQLNRLFAECSDTSCQFVRDDNGHIKLVKSAQASGSWKDYFSLAKQVKAVKADSAEKAELLHQMAGLRDSLDIKDLQSEDNLKAYVEAMAINDPELHAKELNPLLEKMNAGVSTQPMQENQFTSPDGPDKDVGLDGGQEVTMPADEQMSGDRVSKVVNPSEAGAKPDKGGDIGPEMGSASDRFEFGNMASFKVMLTAKGGKKTADIDENLNLLLKQTQEIETEMNRMKETLNINNTNTIGNSPVVEDLKMNEARLKLRAAQRKALLEKEAHVKLANMTCSKCNEVVADEAAAKMHADVKHKGEEGALEFKRAWYLGTEEPKPGSAQYKPENGGEPKIRMNDKQMHQDGKMGGPEGAFPGDEAEKKKHLRAELEERALKRRAWWLGTEEPKPGKQQYKVDPLQEKLRDNEDRQMKQDKSMGGADGSFPGDEAEKKKHLRAELVGARLRTKFTKVRNPDGSLNKNSSYFEIFANENKLLKATAEEIYGEELEKTLEGTDKTAWDVLSSTEYGVEVMAAIRADGFEKVAYLLKGAQAMPELPPAMDAGAPPAAGEAPAPDEEPKPMQNELMSLVNEQEDVLSKMKEALTGEDEGDVKDMSVEMKDEDADAAEAAGAELTASVITLGREVYAELDRSADEIALLVNYFEKSASLSAAKKAELNKLAEEAVADGKALLEEAETILAVAGKVPAGLKAFQDKQKGKKKDDDKDDKKSDKKEDKKDKKEDKKEKKDEKKDKKDDKKKDKKKSKKAELAETLLKLADELNSDEDEEITATAEMDDLDKEMKELGLLPSNAADDKKKCDACGMAEDDEHKCTASAKDELVREALAARRAKREALLKSAEEKKYDVTPDMHGHVDEAHKGGEANPSTQLDVKPAGDGAVIEGIDKIHDAMMGAAEAAPSGKQGSSTIEVKEAEIKAELEVALKTKKAEEDKTKFRVKLRRAYDLGLQMQDKGMIPRTKEALDVQVDEIMKFDDGAFESYRRVVSNTSAQVKTASHNVPQVGVREDNSQPGDNAADVESFADRLKKMW